MNTNHFKSLYSAVIRLLSPLVRILLRYGVSYQSFCELAKRAYVEIADNEFRIEGRKQTVSRISVITGISRKEVMRVKQAGAPGDSHPDEEKFNRAARVITAWSREKDFVDDRGRPAHLPLTGPDASFSELIRRFSGDVPVRATLDELVRVGAVKHLEDGALCLTANAYIPEKSDSDILHILGKDVSHLISTLDHNLKSGSKAPFFQREVAYDNLPDQVLPKYRKLSAQKAQSLLAALDKWLARHDRDVSPEVTGEGRNYAGLGIYYFEGTASEKENP